MRLHRIRLSAVRKLDPGCLIDDLSPGLNIVGGDNEEGKSSLLLALKCAFFLNHGTSGQLRERLVPYGSKADPTIEIDFELAGERLALVKPFKKTGTQLTAGERVWRDGDADDELERRLRFARPGRAPRQLGQEHFGLTGLFWVDQGTSFELADPTADNQRRLGDLLAKEIGTTVAGENDAQIVTAARERAQRYWTDALREKRASPLVDAKAARDELLTEAAASQAQVDRLEDAFAKLEGLREAERRIAEDDEAGRLTAKITNAEASIERQEAMRRQLAILEQAVENAQARCERLDQAQQQRSTAAAEIAHAQAEIEKGQQTLADISQTLAEAVAAQKRCVQAEQAAEATAKSARKAFEGAERREARRRQTDTLNTEKRRLDEISGLGEALAKLTARLADNPVDEKALAKLAETDRACRDAEATLQAVATRLEFSPGAGQSIKVDGTEHAAGQPLDLSEPTTIELGGFGTLRVMPGGADVRAARDGLTAKRRLRDAMLQDLGIEDFSRGERRARERLADLAEKTALDTQLKRLLLDDTADGLRRRIADLEARLAELPAVASGEIAVDLNELRAAAVAAGDAFEAAIKDSRMAERQYEKERQAQATSHALLDERKARLVALDARLTEARAEMSDAALIEAQQAANAELTRLVGEFTSLKAVVGSSDPAMLRDAIGMHEKALLDLKHEANERQDRMRELQFEIKSEGGKGLGERLDTVKERLAAAEREVVRHEREAAAWKLLVETLEAEQKQARDRFAGPIRERLAPLVQQILPRSLPVVDPGKVRLVELERQGHSEALAELSLGTREQLAVLVRLAFADLLLEHEGEAPPIILDDALVYADETRFDRMKLLLQKKAERHQIIVLTCRPRDYRGLEAKRYDLADCLLA